MYATVQSVTLVRMTQSLVVGDNEASVAVAVAEEVCVEDPFANCADGDDAPRAE